jgi:hypothetical protein
MPGNPGILLLQMVGPARRLGAAVRTRIGRLQDVVRHPARRRGPAPQPTGDRVLVTGWFSWSAPSVTAGDLLARDVACRWLEQAERDYDVANAPEFGEGVDWRKVDPGRYSDAIFVCGPVESGRPLNYLMELFAGSRWAGLNVTMLRPLEDWNPFDILLERDSSASSRPDLAFIAEHDPLPLIGVVMVEPYEPEYPDRDRQAEVDQAVATLLAARAAVRIEIDTRLMANETGLRSSGEVESAIARMDAVVTTRLHGLVLALKHGVPALAIDPVAGGAKISAQAAVVGWPVVRTADALDPAELDSALDYCLSSEARELARECAKTAGARLDDLRAEFQAAFRRKGGTA